MECLVSICIQHRKNIMSNYESNQCKIKESLKILSQLCGRDGDTPAIPKTLYLRGELALWQVTLEVLCIGTEGQGPGDSPSVTKGGNRVGQSFDIYFYYATAYFPPKQPQVHGARIRAMYSL